jgi:methyl-accepting chemotaxis protein
MTISVNDQRLLEGKQQALDQLRELEFEDEAPTRLVETARTVLEESIDEYKKAIRREDLTDEVREVMQEPRRKAGDALVRIYYALRQQYAERRAKGEPLTERDQQVEEFLRNVNPGEYITSSFPGALEALEQALEFANQHLSEDVVDISNQAVERARETRQQIEDLGERALKVYSNVEEARETAKSNYLAVREMVSAALRLTDRYDELNDLTPPVSDIMSPKPSS